MEPQIRYARTADGVAIAYAVVGEGPPLLLARSFLSPGLDDEIAGAVHPSSFGSDPGAPQVWPALTSSHSVVLWDVRGGGLSANTPEPGFDDWLADIDAVADAAGAGSFDLAASNVPCHLAMAYAARNPQRVNRLVLIDPFPPGTSVRSLQPSWLFALAPEHWNDFVDILALRMHTWERADIAKRWADRMRAHYTPESFLHFMDVIELFDATRDAGSIRAPTLVIGGGTLRMSAAVEVTRRFQRQLAATIPGAQLAIIKPGDASVAQVVERFYRAARPIRTLLRRHPA